MTAAGFRSARPDFAADRDARALASMLREDRVTLVFSPAGPARDALLQRDFMPQLARRSIDGPIIEAAAWSAASPLAERRRRRSDSRRGAEVAIRFDDWGITPLQSLAERLGAVLPLAAGQASPPTLADRLRTTAQQHDVQLLLVLDRFERHLAISPDDCGEAREFDRQLIDSLRARALPVRVLFVVDDASQERLRTRYAGALPQLDRGWLRIRPRSSPAQAPEPPTDREVPTLETPLEMPLDAPVQPSLAAVPDSAPAAAVPDLGTYSPGLDAATEAMTNSVPDAATADALSSPAAHERIAASPPIRATEPMPGAAPAPPRRWAGTLAGVGLGIVVGIGLAGWFVAWHQLRQQSESLLVTPPAATGAATAPAQKAAPAPQATPAPPPQPAPAAAQTERPPAVAGPRVVQLAVPADSGAARARLDELAQVVAPAGITLRLLPTGADDASSLLRGDALPTPRDGGPSWLLPLYREPVQVVVRADGRQRFLHQLRGLQTNVGEAGGARAQTANALYRRLFGTPLPSWDVDRRDEASALRELLRPGSTLDAVVVVSDRSALEQLPAAQRAQLRVLALDAQHPSTAEVSRGFHLASDPNGRGLLPQATSHLVFAKADAAAAQALACALLRAQGELQRRGSALLRGIDARTPLPPGSVSVLAQAEAGCPRG